MKAAVFPNFNKKNALSCAVEVCSILHSCGVEILVDGSFGADFGNTDYIRFGKFEDFLDEADMIIAIGGDGTILRCARSIVGKNLLLLGINTGRLGFMSTIEDSELYLLVRIAEGNFTIEERMLLSVRAVRAAGGSDDYTVLNDVHISRYFPKLVDFTLSSSGRPVLRCRADGIVFSTPTGSTAYSLSAGGPIIEPSLQCIEFAQVCPHSLFSRAMLFSPDKKLELRYDASRADEMYFSIDGDPPRRLFDGDYIEVTRSPYSVKMIDIKGGSFYDSVDRKLMRPLKEQ